MPWRYLGHTKTNKEFPGRFVEVKMLTSRSEWGLMVEQSEKGIQTGSYAMKNNLNSEGIKTI
jgi:hypothetical protein